MYIPLKVLPHEQHGRLQIIMIHLMDHGWLAIVSLELKTRYVL